MLKNHKPFVINICNYWNTSLQIHQVFGHFFSLWNFGHVTSTPKLGLHEAFISTHIVFKFQLCTSSGFWVISELINFQAKKSLLFFCVSQFMITRPRIPEIGTLDAFIKSYIEAKFQLSRFYRLLVTIESILICQNSQIKTKVLLARAKSQLI